MNNAVMLTVAQLEDHIMSLLRGSVPNITTSLIQYGTAVVKIPIKIERVDGELKTTVGIGIQLCPVPELYVSSPVEEVRGNTEEEHF
ncbi:MAG: hypothetical protein IMF11_05675 [Proteobacteria bacterium]|nr:hypothetical protein [Pseudomonadota bacterium]